MSSAADIAVRPPGTPGFRLRRVELMDWGRFRGGPHVLVLNAESVLLTGSTAAVQSDWVDALMTLVAPRAPRPGGDPANPAVILGVFHDAGTNETLALAHIDWHQADAAGASRSYVCAERELAIAEHFVPAGLQREALTGRLRELGARVEAAFAPYAAWMRRLLGIRDPHALTTIRRLGSMHALGDLDAVVRRHILERFDVAPQLAGVFSAYEAAHEASQALQDARGAVNALAAVTRELERFRGAMRGLEELRAAHDELPGHFAQLKLALLAKQTACMQTIRMQLGTQIERLDRRLSERRSQASELRIALAQHGGDRLERLSLEIRRLVGTREQRRAKAERYGELLRRLGEETPTDESQFHAQRRRLQRMREEARDRDGYLARALPEYAAHLQRVSEELDALPGDADSLQARVHQLGVRVAAITQLIEREQGQRRTLGERLEALARLEEFPSFEELDWNAVAVEIADRMEERERLEASADVLRSLSQQLHRVEQEVARSERELDTAKDRRSRIEQRMHEAEVARSQHETRRVHSSTARDPAATTAVADRLERLRSRVPGGDEPNLESCDAIEADTRAALLRAMHTEEEACHETRWTLLQAMTAFRSGHPRYGRGVEASIDAAERYAERLEGLQTSVVPTLEKELGTRVERGLSDELMSLEAGFAHGRFLVREQVARLNEALGAIAPACGRELVLEATPHADGDVQAFQTELRRCIEEIRSGSFSAEGCVERVGALLEGLSPRPKASEYDRSRIAKLLDVRHAFCYRIPDLAAGHASSDGDRSGSRHIADGTEVCMVLVADLHRRLGKGGNGVGPRSLRLIVLGAGITRGSDACLRFTLALLRRLEMQVVVVAPLGKVTTVEPFVQRVGLVHETSSGEATLQTLTIEAQR